MGTLILFVAPVQGSFDHLFFAKRIMLFFCHLSSETVLVTAAAGALGLATVDIAANALGATVRWR